MNSNEKKVKIFRIVIYVLIVLLVIFSPKIINLMSENNKNNSTDQNVESGTTESTTLKTETTTEKITDKEEREILSFISEIIKSGKSYDVNVDIKDEFNTHKKFNFKIKINNETKELSSVSVFNPNSNEQITIDSYINVLSEDIQLHLDNSANKKAKETSSEEYIAHAYFNNGVEGNFSEDLNVVTDTNSWLYNISNKEIFNQLNTLFNNDSDLKQLISNIFLSIAPLPYSTNEQESILGILDGEILFEKLENTDSYAAKITVSKNDKVATINIKETDDFNINLKDIINHTDPNYVSKNYPNAEIFLLKDIIN